MEDQRKECLIFFYSISKQGTKKVYTYNFFFLEGGGGGGGVGGGGGDKDRVLKGIQTENIGKLVGRRGTSQFISGELGNRLPAYCSKHSK